MQSIIHQGHSGVENLKKTCHSSPALWKKLIVIWKNRIEDIKKCPTCLAFCNQKPSELAVKYPVPQEPWSKLAANLFGLYGSYYLLVVHNWYIIPNYKNL